MIKSKIHGSLAFFAALAVLVHWPIPPAAGAPRAVFTEYASNIREADGLAFDGEGDLFVAAETWRGAVYRIGAGGKTAVFARGIPSADGIAISRDGTMYVTSETTSGFVGIVEKDGVVRSFVRLRNPEGMAFDAEGNLCVAEDVVDGRIVRIRDGRVEVLAEGLNRPENIAFDSTGNLYVTETGTSKILKIDPQGSVRLFTDRIETPDGIAYSPDFGGFFVTQDKAHDAHVYFVGLDGSVKPVLDGLREPQGIALDGHGNLYISEQGRHRILRVSAEQLRV